MTSIVLDFNDLTAGDVVKDQFVAVGVKVSSGADGTPPMIFDTANPTGNDWDLGTDNMGNVLIVSEDGDSNDPDDDQGGGTLTFDFETSADVQSLNVIDTEEGGSIRLYGCDGELIKTIEIPVTEDNGQASVEIDVDGVYRMEVEFNGSGGLDDVSYDIDLEQCGGLDGIVEGTSGDDLINRAYTEDPQGDRIDHHDAVLPGQAPNDDIVYAGAGDDTVMGEKSDDTIYGDRAFAPHSPVEITVTASLAAFDNQLFAYTIDPETGDVSNLVILSENVKDDIGETLEYYAEPCAVVGVGIISPEGTFVSSGYGENVDLNPDGKVHTALLGQGDNGSMNLGFEDLLGLGDSDFNDVEVNVNLGTSGASFDNAYCKYTSDEREIDDSAIGDDTLYGNGGDDTIYGQGGDDTIYGGDGADWADGGDGNDRISLGGDDRAADHAEGGADRDTFSDIGLGDVIVGGEAGDDFDTLDLRGSGPVRVEWTNDDPSTESGTISFLDRPGGDVRGTATFSEIESVIPCFTPGTLVATPAGAKLVEDLTVGDRILTRDNGVQEVRWYGQRRLDYTRVSSAVHLQPVLIRKGALGDGQPARDMLVSPNHRMLIANDRTALYFGEHEVLVAAKHLIGRPGIERACVSQTTYIHFMFDQHEVVLADAAWTESFQPGDYTLEGIDTAQRDEILQIFPELRHQDGIDSYLAARKTLKRHEAALLT